MIKKWLDRPVSIIWIPIVQIAAFVGGWYLWDVLS